MTAENHDIEILPKRNVFVFSDTMDMRNRDAAKECHVFAMSAASAEFNPVTQAAEWFQNYTSVMQQAGWLPVNYKTETVTDGGKSMSASNLVGKGLKLAASYLSGGVKDTVQKVGTAAMDAIANSPDAVTVFDIEAKEIDNTALTLAQCEQSPGGEVVMFIVSIQSDGDPVTNYKGLLFNWTSHTNLTVTNSAALVLHRGLYESVRDVLTSRVSSNSRKSLLSMKLKV
ncbi:hypothetical protein F7234_20615 [Pseudomonas putida]|uniref:hypothetical protein n=1 Tax=Pseudomonas putida TaxID=303 RepID=UPI00125F4C32|nr:hypothetical protein [Pseudomonas putida]KAB5620764.1 hypothetical protein F7234_20615 [Pseudomonas putida]